MHASERKKDSTNEEPAPEKDAHSSSKSSDDAAAQKAEEASEAKSEELRTALQSKSEQGKSSWARFQLMRTEARCCGDHLPRGGRAKSRSAKLALLFIR
jgi:hypothetical protein